MFQNPPLKHLGQILQDTRTIAVVGLSDNPERESYMIAHVMQANGYRIIPVNPNVEKVLGEKAYASLREIPEDVDIVNVFRRSEALLAVVQEAVEITAPVIWAQQGVYDEAAAALATASGKTMVMDACIKVVHSLTVNTHETPK